MGLVICIKGGGVEITVYNNLGYHSCMVGGYYGLVVRPQRFSFRATVGHHFEHPIWPPVAILSTKFCLLIFHFLTILSDFEQKKNVGVVGLARLKN